jgi:NPCBM/NEW2 domain
MMRFAVVALSILASTSVAAPPGELPRALCVDAEPFHAALEGAGPGWQLRFGPEGAARQLAAERLVAWGRFVEPRAGIHVVLADGGILIATKVHIDREQLHGESPACQTWSLPLELVAGLVLRPPSEPAAVDAWLARIVAANSASDRVLLDNGDELTGVVAGLDENGLSLETDGGKSKIAIDQAAAIIFNATLVHKARPSGLRAIVGLNDGSRLLVIDLAADQERAKLRLAGGADLEAATGAIVCLKPLGGRTVYLSDLKPAGYRHVPFLQMSWPFQIDRSVLGGQLRAGGRPYAKGLGMHSPARITYDIGDSFRRFESEVAVDAESGSRGSVVFRVFTDDGSGTLVERATSEVVRGGQDPVPIAVGLSGVKRLSLLVDFADHGDELDHADWLDARLLK